MKRWLLFSALMLIFSMSANVIAEERDDLDRQTFRLRAFSEVQMNSSTVKSHPASDPQYAQNHSAIQKDELLLNGYEIISVQKTGVYIICYPKNKVVAYASQGKTEAVGYMTQHSFPYKTVLYHYPSGKLKTITLSLSPQDVFVFDTTGKLIEGNVETALWGKPSHEKKVSAIGLKLLSANKIKEKISFAIESGESSNANSDEMTNEVNVTKGMLAYIESDDELAAILAHEIAHIILRHRHIYPEPTNDDMLQRIVLRVSPEPRRDSYEFDKSQQKELDADRMGLRMLVRAGYRPEAMISIFQKTMSDGSESDMSTHPSASHRIKALETQIRKMAAEKAAGEAKK